MMWVTPTSIRMNTFLQTPLKPTAEDSFLSIMAHGMTRVYLREAYRCHTKLNHPNGCAGPSSYSAELINDVRREIGDLVSWADTLDEAD